MSSPFPSGRRVSRLIAKTSTLGQMGTKTTTVVLEKENRDGTI